MTERGRLTPKRPRGGSRGFGSGRALSAKVRVVWRLARACMRGTPPPICGLGSWWEPAAEGRKGEEQDGKKCGKMDTWGRCSA